jgi:hypothetical protein
LGGRVSSRAKESRIVEMIFKQRSKWSLKNDGMWVFGTRTFMIKTGQLQIPAIGMVSVLEQQNRFWWVKKIKSCDTTLRTDKNDDLDSILDTKKNYLPHTSHSNARLVQDFNHI